MVISKKAVLSVSLFALLLWGVVLSTFANPPTSPYGVSQNIVDPACAPNSLNCYVASLSIGDTVGNNPDLNGILYTDANSQVITDDQFTRDSVTHETVIGQDFTVSVDTVDVTLSVVIFMDPNDVSGPFSQGDSIVGATSGATATVDYYNNTNGFGYFSNVVGDFQQGETINNITSGAISIAGQTLEHDSFVVDDTINFYSPGSQSIIGTGVVTAVSGNTATIRVTGVTTVPAQYDLVLDSVQGGTKLWGMTSFAVNSNPETRYGQFSTGTILGFFQGIGLTYSDNGSRYATQVVGGVVGGDAYVTGSLVGDSSINNYATIFQNLNGVGSSPSIEMGTVDALNNHNTNVLLNRSRIVLQANEEVALLASRVQIGGYDYNNDDPDNHFYPAYSTYYYLPTTRGTAGQVLTDVYGDGNVTWEDQGGLIPDQSGHIGEFLLTDGSTLSWATIPWAAYTIPTDGDPDQVLTTDGSGLLSWTTPTSSPVVLNASGTLHTPDLGAGAGSTAPFEGSNIMLGDRAGANGSNVSTANFIGALAGSGATNANNSNFLGTEAGTGAAEASYSNFIGWRAGYNAINAGHSVFIGSSYSGGTSGAGTGATNANSSVFIGSAAGNLATNASFSSFFGAGAGSNATNASNSIFIGQSAGASDTANNTGNVDDFNILIGKSTSTGGFSNSIAIGGSATNTASNQFMIGSATRPIDTTRINGSSSTQCTITTGTGIACTSDERVKTNITDLTTDTLDKLLNVKTVTYNWLQNPTSKTQIGFLAQDLEQYFPELVETDSVGMRSVYYAQMTPILVEAIREMNLKITTINDVETPNTWRDSLIAWFGNASNKITRIFTGELCLYDENGQTECINASQLRELKQSQNIQNQNTPQPPTVDIPPTEEPPSENTPPPTEEPPVVEPT